MTSKTGLRLTKGSNGVRLFSRFCIKSTGFTSLSEAAAMEFVRQNTSVPVPKVYCAFIRKGRTYIVMQRISGDMLARGWVKRSESSKQKILCQVKAMLEEIRHLPVPDDVGVANVGGGPIFNILLPKTPWWGPFESIQDFHRALRNDIEGIDLDDEKLPGLRELIAFHKQSDHSLVLTHGDLSSLNIMAKGDTVTGIIDWETAGWLPRYWEHTSAWHVNPANTFWQNEVDNILYCDPYALNMEAIRRRYFGHV